MDIKNIIIIILICGLGTAGYFYNKKAKELDKEKLDKQTLDKDLHGKITIQGNTITSLQRELDKIKAQVVYVPDEGKINIVIKENESLKKQIAQMNIDQFNLNKQLAVLLEKIKNAKSPEEIAKLQNEADEVKKKLEEQNKKLQAAEDQLQQFQIITQTTGFTLRLGGGVCYTDKLKPEIDIKWAYMDHFSLVTGIAIDPSDFRNSDILMDITTHFNLFTPPKWHIDNIEVGIGPSYSILTRTFGLNFLLRTNF